MVPLQLLLQCVGIAGGQRIDVLGKISKTRIEQVSILNLRKLPKKAVLNIGLFFWGVGLVMAMPEVNTRMPARERSIIEI